MTDQDMTREQVLETLRSAKTYVSTAWNSEEMADKNIALGRADNQLSAEIRRLETRDDYVTPAPAPVDLYFLKPEYKKDREENGPTASPEDELTEMLWDIMDEYDVPATNNEPRWQDGRWLREAGAYIGHIKQAIDMSGAYVPRRQVEILERIKDDAIEVANAEKRKRIELELELEMWQKGYRKNG